MSPELEKFLECSFKLRKTLEQVLPKEAIDYIFETQLQSPTQPNEDVKVYQYQPK